MCSIGRAASEPRGLSSGGSQFREKHTGVHTPTRPLRPDPQRNSYQHSDPHAQHLRARSGASESEKGQALPTALPVEKNSSFACPALRQSHPGPDWGVHCLKGGASGLAKAKMVKSWALPRGRRPGWREKG